MNRKGFTLIELLIVVVIIGILAAIAIPKFANTKEKAYIASMKSDLRNMVTAEEAYFADSVKYSTNVQCANPAPAGSVAWCATTGNSLQANPTIGTGTQAGGTDGKSGREGNRGGLVWWRSIRKKKTAATAHIAEMIRCVKNSKGE